MYMCNVYVFLLLNNVPNIVVFFPGFICRQNVWIFSLLGRWAHPAALLWYYPQSSNAFKWYFMDSLPHSEMCVCVWFFCVITWQWINMHWHLCIYIIFHFMAINWFLFVSFCILWLFLFYLPIHLFHILLTASSELNSSAKKYREKKKNNN